MEEEVLVNLPLFAVERLAVGWLWVEIPVQEWRLALRHASWRQVWHGVGSCAVCAEAGRICWC